MQTVPYNQIASQKFQPVPLDVPDHASFQSHEEVLAFAGIVTCSTGVINHLYDSELIDLGKKRNFRAKVIEVGTYRGCSTVQIAALVPNAEIHSVNILPEQANEDAFEMLPREEIGRVAREKGVTFTQHYGNSQDVRTWENLPKADVIFIDGDHRFPAVMRDTVLALGHLNPGGVLIWHDYHDRNDLGRQVQRAIEEIDHALDGKVRHVEGTSLCYYVKED